MNLRDDEEALFTNSRRSSFRRLARFSRPVCSVLRNAFIKVDFAVLLRTEFKAYKDVKPVKLIKAPSQYKPPGQEASLETSYNATYKGEQVKAQANDNKLLERRRIRSLYSEPGKETAKVRHPQTCKI